MNYNKPLTLNEYYKIRKEKNGALLFYRKDFSVLKTSDFVFDIISKIDLKHYSVNQLISYII